MNRFEKDTGYSFPNEGVFISAFQILMVQWVKIPGGWCWGNDRCLFSKVSMAAYHNLSLLVSMHFPLCGMALASGPQTGDLSLRSRPCCPAHSSALNFAAYLFASAIKATQSTATPS